MKLGGLDCTKPKTNVTPVKAIGEGGGRGGQTHPLLDLKITSGSGPLPHLPFHPSELVPANIPDGKMKTSGIHEKPEPPPPPGSRHTDGMKN